MQTVTLNEDIKVFYVTADSFPDGIAAAMQKLHQLFTFSKARRIFGLSRPENNGKIVYRAAAEELAEGEAIKFHCDTLLIRKGTFISLTVHEFRQDVMRIDRAFKQLLKESGLDPQGYCVEWYASDSETVQCMVRLNDTDL